MNQLGGAWPWPSPHPPSARGARSRAPDPIIQGDRTRSGATDWQISAPSQGRPMEQNGRVRDEGWQASKCCPQDKRATLGFLFSAPWITEPRKCIYLPLGRWIPLGNMRIFVLWEIQYLGNRFI